MPNKVSKISVVSPVCNEEDNLEIIYERIRESCIRSGVDYEIIFVDDGSDDNSLNVMKKIRAQDKKVIYISLSRNFGHQNALFAGMFYCTGDAVITMDADLQHPPSLIPQMIDLWRKGVEVVYMTKKNSNLPFIKHIIIKATYIFISKLSGLKLDFGQSDFRLIDKKVLKIILKMPEYHKFLRGQVSWIGFRQEGLPYDVERRYSGKAKFTYRRLYELALNGIFSFGKYQLHLVMLFGLVIFSISGTYLLFVPLAWLLKMFNISLIAVPSGGMSLIMTILFLASIQLMAIGILSEYVGRIYEQTMGRPVFIIKEMSHQEE